MKSFIIDTDVGSDVDDVWALVYMILSGVNIKLIIVSHRNTFEKAKIVAKILAIEGRTDIPIAIGPTTSLDKTRLNSFIEDFDLSNYTGLIESEGLALLNETIRKNPNCTILGLSPATTLSKISDTLDISSVKLIQMAGSFSRGYDETNRPSIEWNIKEDIDGFRSVLQRFQNILLVPLDVAGLVICGKDYSKIEQSQHWAAHVILDCYKVWDSKWSRITEGRSSKLFDLVAADIAIHQDVGLYTSCQIEVSDDGFTKIAPYGAKISYVSEYPTQNITNSLLRYLDV